MTTETAKQVDHQSAAVQEMAKEWPQIRALLGGTSAMRAARTTYLPKFPAEDDESYKTRLAQATLFPAYRRTTSVMAGKPFSKQVTLGDKTPPKVVEWCEDIDRQGTSLHVFAAEMMQEAMNYGLGGILVDAPKDAAQSQAARPPTQAEQSAAGVRPYFVPYRHDQILGWRLEQTPAGARLAMLRLLEVTTEPDGEYGEKEVTRVRVLTPGAWALKRKVSDTEWVDDGAGKTGIDYIPFVPLYGIRVAFMVGRPPLVDLAYLNVEHWQSSSDQQNILHVARVPILVLKTNNEQLQLVVGGAAATKIDANDSSNVFYAEHSGAAIGAGRQSLLDLEGRMIASGAELVVAKPGQRTATESSNDIEGNKSDLQRIVEVFEDSLDLALYYLEDLGGQAHGSKVTLFKDFNAATLSDASAQLVQTMAERGLITKATAIREQQRRGVLSGDVNPEEEPTLAAAETVPDDGDDPDKKTPPVEE